MWWVRHLWIWQVISRFFCHPNSGVRFLFPMTVLNVIFLRTSLPVSLVLWNLVMSVPSARVWHVNTHMHTHKSSKGKSSKLTGRIQALWTKLERPIPYRIPDTDSYWFLCTFLSSLNTAWKSEIAFGLYELRLWPNRLGSSWRQVHSSTAGMGPLGGEQTWGRITNS